MDHISASKISWITGVKYSALLMAISCLFSVQSIAQCVPDPSCIDIGEPGEICPEVLENATLNVYHEQIITIIPPDSAVILGNVIYLSAVQLSYINNLPPGLSFESNANNHLFPAGDKYCVKISGTPTQTGDFQLVIGVIPYIGGIPFTIGLTEDTTLNILVQEEIIGIQNLSEPKPTFQIAPNPFHNFIQLTGIPTSTTPWVFELFDQAGRRVYSGTISHQKKMESINLNDIAISQNFLFYRFMNNQTIFSGKLIRH